MLFTIIASVVAFAVGAGAFFYVGIRYRKKIAESTVMSAEQQAQKIIEDSKKDAERVKKDAILQAKDEMIKQHLYPFLKDHMSYLPEKIYLPHVEKIRNKNVQEVIDYLENEDIDYIYYHRFDSLSYGNRLNLMTSSIYYLIEGKVSFEEYSHTFNYIHQRLRAPHQNPLEGATYLSLH